MRGIQIPKFDQGFLGFDQASLSQMAGIQGILYDESLRIRKSSRNQGGGDLVVVAVSVR